MRRGWGTTCSGLHHPARLWGTETFLVCSPVGRGRGRATGFTKSWLPFRGHSLPVLPSPCRLAQLTRGSSHSSAPAGSRIMLMLPCPGHMHLL